MRVRCRLRGTGFNRIFVPEVVRLQHSLSPSFAAATTVNQLIIIGILLPRSLYAYVDRLTRPPGSRDERPSMHHEDGDRTTRISTA
jgi:hypothetical protein